MARAKGGYVYIITNKKRTVIYIGVTSNLLARMIQHRAGIGSQFASRYRCTDLVFYRFFDTIMEAIKIEKQLKKWKRDKKDEYIKAENPDLMDLFPEAERLYLT